MSRVVRPQVTILVFFDNWSKSIFQVLLIDFRLFKGFLFRFFLLKVTFFISWSWSWSWPWWGGFIFFRLRLLFLPWSLFWRTRWSRIWRRFPSLAVVYLSSFLKILRKVLFLHFFNNVSHLNWIVSNGISICFFFFHDLIHWILMKQLKVLTILVSYFFLEDVFKAFISWFCLFCSCQKFLISLLLGDFITPIVHPFHAIEMGPRYKSSLDLDSLQFIIMLFLK